MIKIETITILLIVLGFFAFVMLVFGIFMFVLFRRRKLIYCRFLDSSGKWEVNTYYKLDKSFDYDGSTYNFDIKLCTRDKLNRPIASYYKGNVAQIQFDYTLNNKAIKIGTQEITGTDMRQILLTKIIKDIFSDDDIKMWFIIIMVLLVIGFGAVIILMQTGDNTCNLVANNATIDVIKQGVLSAINGGTA